MNHWQEIGDRFAAVDSYKAFEHACKLAGMTLKEMLEAGIVRNDALLELSQSASTPSIAVADFTFRVLWQTFADQYFNASEIEMRGNVGFSNYQNDWKLVSQNYVFLCKRLDVAIVETTWRELVTKLCEESPSVTPSIIASAFTSQATDDQKQAVLKEQRGEPKPVEKTVQSWAKRELDRLKKST